jgi:GTP-binding protein Era
MTSADTRAGIVALAGRPNGGKSTLVNHIVGEKVAIASDKPQTTRHAIRGIACGSFWQLVLVDLPGVQRPRDALTERMQQRVYTELADCDAALFVVNGRENIGPGDRFIARTLREAGVSVATAVNKIDLLSRKETLDALLTVNELGLEGEIYPVSARTGSGICELVDGLVQLLPHSPFLYPTDSASDLPWHKEVTELIREQVLKRTFEELPHAVDVELTDSETRDDGLLVLCASIWVESESQKAIVVGRQGHVVRDVGTAARRELEARLAGRVHLDLVVRVRKRWRRNEALLDRLGIQ